jgi:hypothetical protein
VCNRSFGFGIHSTGNISAIYTLIGFVVGIAGSAVITGAVITGAVIAGAIITAAVVAFTRNVFVTVAMRRG